MGCTQICKCFRLLSAYLIFGWWQLPVRPVTYRNICCKSGPAFPLADAVWLAVYFLNRGMIQIKKQVMNVTCFFYDRNYFTWHREGNWFAENWCTKSPDAFLFPHLQQLNGYGSGKA